jgi:hypothetical protein
LLEVDDSEVVVSAAATPARKASTRDDNLMVKGVACVYPERTEEEGAVLTSDLERKKRVRSQVGGLQWMLFFFCLCLARSPESWSAQTWQQLATNTSTTSWDYQRNQNHRVSNFWSNQGLVGTGAALDDVASNSDWAMGQLIRDVRISTRVQ